MGVCASKPSTVESAWGDAVDAPTPHVAVQRPTPREMLDISFSTTNTTTTSSSQSTYTSTVDSMERFSGEPASHSGAAMRKRQNQNTALIQNTSSPGAFNALNSHTSDPLQEIFPKGELTHSINDRHLQSRIFDLNSDTQEDPSIGVRAKGTRTRREAFSIEATKELVDMRRSRSKCDSEALLKDSSENGSPNARKTDRNQSLRRSHLLLSTSSETPSDDADSLIRSARLVEMVRRHFLFQGLEEEVLQTMVGQMRRHEFSADDTILGQSAEVDDLEPCIFFLLSGKVDLIVHGISEEQKWQFQAGTVLPSPHSGVGEAPGGGRRHLASGTLVPLESLPVLPGTEDERVVASLAAGDCLGESTLLFSAPRSSDTLARTDVVAFSLSRTHMLRARPPTLQTMHFLRAMPLLQKLSDNLLIIVAKRCLGMGLSDKLGGQCTFAAKEVVLRARRPMPGLLLVMTGKLVEEGDGTSARTTVEPYGFVGVRGILLSTAPYAIRAAEASTALWLPGADFLAFLPLLQEVVDAQLKLAALCQLFPASESLLEPLVDLFEEKTLSQGDVIMAAGDPLTAVYVIKAGEAGVLRSNGAVGRRRQYGDMFGTRVVQVSSKQAASLTWDVGTTVTSASCAVLSVSTATMQARLGPLDKMRQSGEVLMTLQQCPQLATLTDAQRASLLPHLKVEPVPNLVSLVRQGVQCKRFFIISSGTALVKQSAQHIQPSAPITSVARSGNAVRELKQPQYRLRELKAGDAVDVESVLNDSPPPHDVVATSQVTLLSMSADEFRRLLLPWRDEILATAKACDQASDVHAQAPINFKHLELMRIIGIGMFGQVRMVVHRFTGVVYAMKCMSKSLISQHGQQQHVENERTIMQQIDHWACVKMICAYRDKATLYILLEMVQGGELFRYLDQKGRLPEKTVCFYAANVYLALDHLHSKGVIHRDLKPENLLIDPDGYIKLVDFGFAKHVGSGSTYTICGTPDYQAPEVVLRKGHDCMSDYWGLGILIYEMLVGSTPFKTKTDNPRDTFRNILQGVYTIPMFVSDQATDMVMRLLQHDPNKRLGRVGRDEVRSHPFFAGIDWDALEKRQLEAPYLPPISSLNDMTNFDQYHDQAIPVSQYDDTNDTVWRGWGHCNPDQKPK